MFGLTDLAPLAEWHLLEKHWLTLKERFGAQYACIPGDSSSGTKSAVNHCATMLYG
jgi:hypothetical protein